MTARLLIFIFLFATWSAPRAFAKTAEQAAEHIVDDALRVSCAPNSLVVTCHGLTTAVCEKEIAGSLPMCVKIITEPLKSRGEITEVMVNGVRNNIIACAQNTVRYKLAASRVNSPACDALPAPTITKNMIDSSIASAQKIGCDESVWYRNCFSVTKDECTRTLATVAPICRTKLARELPAQITSFSTSSSASLKISDCLLEEYGRVNGAHFVHKQGCETFASMRDRALRETKANVTASACRDPSVRNCLTLTDAQCTESFGAVVEQCAQTRLQSYPDFSADRSARIKWLKGVIDCSFASFRKKNAGKWAKSKSGCQ